jgi:hypothetical protein
LLQVQQFLFCLCATLPLLLDLFEQARESIRGRSRSLSVASVHLHRSFEAVIPSPRPSMGAIDAKTIPGARLAT